MSEIEIFHCTFHEGGVEIVYSEERDSSDRVAMQRTIAIPIDVAGIDLAEAIESLQAVVDLGVGYLNNPVRPRRSDLLSKVKEPSADSGQRRMDEQSSVPGSGVEGGV